MRTGNELDKAWLKNFRASQNRLLLKEKAAKHLGGKCCLCGYDKCLAALDFHHPGAKDFNISSKMSWASIEPELEKVLLLCSNCHRETHAGLHPQLLDHWVDEHD